MEDYKNLKLNLERKIAEASSVVIVPHNGIDFDAVASAFAVALIAKKYKKQNYIVVNDPVYKIDHGVQLIINSAKKDFNIINKDKYLQYKDKKDLIILVDVNKKYLISLKDEVIDNEDNVVVIDHHDSDNNTVKASIYHIDSLASSTSEILINLLTQYKIKYSSDVANYLLSGIYLDTNKLTKNVSPDVMKAVAKLLENGADMNVVTDWFAEDFNSDRRVQELVSRAQIITYSFATILAEEGNEYTKEELAKAADYLLKYKVDAAYAIGEIGDNIISISARSKEQINVGKVMQELGGGGNQYSGATKIEDSTIEEVGKKLTKTIKPPFYLK